MHVVEQQQDRPRKQQLFRKAKGNRNAGSYELQTIRPASAYAARKRKTRQRRLLATPEGNRCASTKSPLRKQPQSQRGCLNACNAVCYPLEGQPMTKIVWLVARALWAVTVILDTVNAFPSRRIWWKSHQPR